VRDHHIGALERHMIRTHMFPMVPLPPRHREAWLLCVADKIVATRETARGRTRPRSQPQGPLV
jgi:uncharacterized protein